MIKIGDFHITSGISNKQINQLIALTNSDDLQLHKFTADFKNGNGRFASRANFDKWAKKKSDIYCLQDTEENLVGIIWFSKIRLELHNLELISHMDIKPENYTITFAIRLYSDARGKGLATSFFHETLKLYKQSKQFSSLPKKKCWLSVANDNFPARTLYEKLDFRQITTQPDHNNKHIYITDLDKNIN